MSETKTVEALAIGLEELRKSFEDLSFELPKDFSDSGENVDEIFKLATDIASQVESGLKWLDEKDACLADIKNPLKHRIAVTKWANKADEIEGFLEATLKHEIVYFKMAAAMAYLKHRFSSKVMTIEEACQALSDLEKRGLIALDAYGPIPVGYKKFRLGDFDFMPEEANEIERNIAAFNRKLMALESQNRISKAKAMEKEADITLDGLWDGELGKCFMQVPPEAFTNREGATRWRAGGSVVVMATQKDIRPISGTGKLENVIKSMRELDVSLPRHAIKWKNPPASGISFSRVMDEVLRTHDLSEEEAERFVNGMKSLWYFIHRAFKAQVAKQELQEVKEDYREKATISPEDFFGLNEGNILAEGIACLEYEGAFRVDNHSSVYDLFFLVERAIQDGRHVICVTEMPPHTAEILGELAGKTFSEGINFRELPGVLKQVLTAINTQKDMAYQIARA